MEIKVEYAGYYFLLLVILAYLITGFINTGAVLSSLHFSLQIGLKLVPVFILVFLLMTAFNYLLSPERLKRHMEKFSGIKGLLIAVVGGIISTGPIYMWYPMLRELKRKGIGYGFIATFLYNRAVKLPLIPVMIFYFGLKYTVVLSLVMISVSVLLGFLFEKMERGGIL